MLSFGMLLMPTMYRSYSNYQMSNGCIWGSMNLHMNQCWADIAARQNLYNVPIMNFGNFLPYSNISSMNYLLDPGLAAAQWLGAQMSNSGNIFQNINLNNLPGLPTSDGTSGLSDEEKKAKKEYDKLNLLIKAYCDNTSREGAELKKEMQEALKGKTTWTEKLDVLKDIYKKTDKAELEKALATLESSNPKVNYRTALKNIGYKFDNSNCNDKYIEDVKKLKEEDNVENITKALEKYAKANDANNHILNFISTWNDLDTDTNLVDYAISKANPTGEDDEPETELITNLVNALVKKGNDIKTDPALSTETKTNLGQYIDDLKNELTGITSENSDTRSSSVNSFKQAFDDLYTALRIAETKIIQKQIKEDYGFTADIASDDTDFINDENLVLEETIKDLTETEEIDSTRLEDIKNNKIKLTA